jgi:hypothetical protein
MLQQYFVKYFVPEFRTLCAPKHVPAWLVCIWVSHRVGCLIRCWIDGFFTGPWAALQRTCERPPLSAGPAHFAAAMTKIPEDARRKYTGITCALLHTDIWRYVVDNQSQGRLLDVAREGHEPENFPLPFPIRQRVTFRGLGRIMAGCCMDAPRLAGRAIKNCRTDG